MIVFFSLFPGRVYNIFSPLQCTVIRVYIYYINIHSHARVSHITNSYTTMAKLLRINIYIYYLQYTYTRVLCVYNSNPKRRIRVL